MTFPREVDREKTVQAARDLIKQARVIARTSNWTSEDVGQVLLTARVLGGYGRVKMFADRLNMHIEDSVLCDIDALAKDSGVSRSEWARQAFRHQIARENAIMDEEESLPTARTWRPQANDGCFVGVTVKLEEDLYNDIVDHAERRAMSMSSWMVEACEAELDRYGRLKAKKAS